MTASKRPSLDDLVKPKKEEKEETPVVEENTTHVDPPGMQDGVWIGAVDRGVTQEEINASGNVHVWQENPEHALGKLHPDFQPQAPNPDCVGYSNE